MEIGAAEITSIDEKELVTQGFAGLVGTAYEAGDVHDRGLDGQVHGFGSGCGSHNVLNSEFYGFCGLEHIDFPFVVDKFQGYLRASEGKVLEFSDYVLEFHAVRLEELASCPTCEAVAPLEATVCPCCGLDFNA